MGPRNLDEKGEAMNRTRALSWGLMIASLAALWGSFALALAR